MPEGLIIKGIGGFYYVETADGIFECKARGIFRKKKITPLVGDRVRITIGDREDNMIDEIAPRKNALLRPPLANLDRIFIVSSFVSPAVNTLVLDRMLALAEHKGIDPVPVFTKSDLCEDTQGYVRLYQKAGFETVVCDNTKGIGAARIRELVEGKICAFSGNTGVGKSSLLNQVDSRLAIETGETSKKLGRGRHTTRSCTLYKIGTGYIADTPGFSAMDIENGETIFKDDLAACFREFRPYLGQCKFVNNCAHIQDKGCAVRQAVEDGLIAESRHASYVQMYNEVKDIQPWQQK